MNGDRGDMAEFEKKNATKIINCLPDTINCGGGK